MAQQNNVQEVESKASAIVQQAKSQVLILANQLVTNVSLLTRSAEGNASLLLANLYNDINKGISEAQAKATQVRIKDIVGPTYGLDLDSDEYSVLTYYGQFMTLIHEHSTPRPIQGVTCMYGTFYKPYKTDRQIQDAPSIAFKCNGLLEKIERNFP